MSNVETDGQFWDALPVAAKPDEQIRELQALLQAYWILVQGDQAPEVFGQRVGLGKSAVGQRVAGSKRITADDLARLAVVQDKSVLTVMSEIGTMAAETMRRRISAGAPIAPPRK